MRAEGRKDKKGDRYEEVGSYFDDLRTFLEKVKTLKTFILAE